MFQAVVFDIDGTLVDSLLIFTPWPGMKFFCILVTQSRLLRPAVKWAKAAISFFPLLSDEKIAGHGESARGMAFASV